LIVGTRKPFEEIIALLGEPVGNRILVLGCDSCMAVSLASGEAEVKELIDELREHSDALGLGWEFEGRTLKRQCERKYEERVSELIDGSDAVVSLGCGVGAQMLSENFPLANVVPAINTSNMGAPEARGIFKEKCMGCGDCTIHRTAGVCVLARCSKALQNGPCGGTTDGKCEIDPETDCAWATIYDSLKRRGRLDDVRGLVPPKDWSRSHSGGVRTVRVG